ncbi:MmgE/PrpD family protein [Halalkalicoccus sp. NIPERK01]|uniref:MmgE/PrpD family protein n=1 Tax=Halalkalicoccus sp. NIPERK01 TaxID=3053469 RepID=UPI00256F35E4|nr:MmgE/PrpD family protein [Halalkalicoccus sp. NIPERK01]MDL5363473.1 MmgE/PrpD family protein [Halalkalicoccus sp. NIPERK01]
MAETALLADFTAETTFSDITTDAIDHSQTAIRDYIGVALYGSHHDVGDRISAYVDRSASGDQSTVFCRGTASVPGAALANGAFGHAIDYDDTFESIVIHPTSPVFAASLAAAESIDTTTRDLLTGYVVGCEVAFRVGHSTYPEHYRNGWHATGTIGTFGAVAAAGSVLDLDRTALVHAFGIAASLSSSLKKNFGSMTKPLHAGHAAEMGVRSTLLADEGFTADEAVFEGDLGYGEVMTMHDGYDPAEITEGLGESWNVTDIGYKPYPSGVITHAAMDAMRNLVLEHDLTPETVDRITVSLEDAASEMLIHAQPENALQAKFSIEFCLAAILREGEAGIHEFTDEYVTDPQTRATIDKVERAFEDDLFGDDFAGYGATVRVQTTAGDELTAREQYAPGSPNNPLSEERLRDKFFECAETRLDRSAAEELEATIQRLKDDLPVGELTAQLDP